MGEATIDRVFLDCSVRRLRLQASRIRDCLGRLDAAQVWLRGCDNENAIGNLVLHLCGNVRQWILSGVGGAPDHRERDREFSARGGASPAELTAILDQTVTEAAAVLNGVPANRLLQSVKIQGYEQTVLEAVYHVVEHFSGHTGQVIFATRALTAADLGFYAHLRSGSTGHSEKTP